MGTDLRAARVCATIARPAVVIHTGGGEPPLPLRRRVRAMLLLKCTATQCNNQRADEGWSGSFWTAWRQATLATATGGTLPWKSTGHVRYDATTIGAWKYPPYHGHVSRRRGA